MRESENAYEREGESGSELKVMTAFLSTRRGRSIVNSSKFRVDERFEVEVRDSCQYTGIMLC
jgi:hypothetical protein